jgi:hypothetical protein
MENQYAPPITERAAGVYKSIGPVKKKDEAGAKAGEP